MIDTRTLAVGCACYVKGWAILNFPDSSVAAPSFKVWVQPSAATPKRLPMAGGEVSPLPLVVSWDIWQKVVVPTLVGFEPPWGPFSSLVDVLQASLTGKLQSEGYIPL